MATTRSGGATPNSASKLKSQKSPRKRIQAKRKKREVQYRSNLQCAITEIEKLNLNEKQIEALRDYCPFWYLIEAVLEKKITLSSTKKSDVEVKNLLEKFNKSNKTFEIGGKSIKLTKEDVVRVFGVKGGNRTVATSRDKCTETSIYKNNFENKIKPTTSSMSVALENAVTSERENAEHNVVQLVMLYLLAAVFAPTKGTTFSWRYNKILTVVEDINSYDWPKYIYDYLMKSLMTKPAEKVIGCVVLIPYWIMETFQVATPLNENAELLCVKWDLQNFNVLGTMGIVTQVIKSQETQTKNGTVGEEIGDTNEYEDSANSDNEGSNVRAEEGNVCTGTMSLELSSMMGAINLAEKDTDWDKTCISTMVKKRKLKEIESDDLVKKLEEDNKKLKEEKRVRESENSALKRRIAGLEKKEEDLLAQIENKDAQITLMEQALAGLQGKITITTNETKALRKRVKVKNSKVNELVEVREKLVEENNMLEQTKMKLVDENTELVVQRVTQAAYALKDSGNSGVIKKLEFGALDQQQNSMTNIGHAVVDSLKETRSNKNFDRSPILLHTDIKKPISLNLKSKIANQLAEKRISKPAPRRDSWCYGSEAEEKRRKKIKSQEEECILAFPATTVIPLTTILPQEDDFVVPPTKERVSRKSRDKDKFTKMKHYLHLIQEQKDKLTMIESSFGPGYLVVKFKNHLGAVVLLDDLYKIINGDMMSSLIVNAHAEILVEKYKTPTNRNFTIFESTTWLVTDPMAKNRIEYIDKAIEDAPVSGVYLFPIVSNGGMEYKDKPDHWTLLLHDLQDPVWKLYNSIQSTGKETFNPYRKDVEKLMAYIIPRIRSKWRKLQQSNSKSLPAYCTPDHVYTLNEPKCPEQPRDSLDCRIFMCHAMEQIAKGQEVLKRLNVDDMVQYKMLMIQRFLDKFDMTRLEDKKKQLVGR